MEKRARIIWICLGIIFFVSGVCSLTYLLDPGTAYCKNKEFTEESGRYDVLFFGDSHMANAVYPMELWHAHGIVSYNLGGFGNPPTSAYWMMKNALDVSSPKLIVMDCHNIRGNGTVSKEMLHNQIDSLPLSVNKLRMINDLVEKPKDRMEYIWTFSLYHDRWWDLDQGDFEKNINIQKGAEIAVDVVPPGQMAEKPAAAGDIEAINADYLRRMIEECRSRNIEILLTYHPFPAADEDWQEALYAEKLAKEYGVPYINFLDLQTVDLNTDCSDENSHLNGSGGRKITAYLGQYIEEHYSIADHRDEAEFADWDEDYMRYTNYKLTVMEGLESLDKYLMMLADPAFDCCIYVDGEARIWRQNEMYRSLIENVSGQKAQALEEATAAGEDYFLVVDRQADKVFEAVGDSRLDADCSFGKICYQTDADGRKTLQLQSGGEKLLAAAQQESEAPAVQIFVMDAADGRPVGEKRFSNKLKVCADEYGETEELENR